jgi:hypothetical protein
MGQTTSAISGVRNVGAFQLKVIARGALIRSFAGSTLMYWAVLLSGNPTSLRFSILALPTVGLIAWAILRVRATRNLPSSRRRSGPLEGRTQVLLARCGIGMGIDWRGGVRSRSIRPF